MAEGLRELVELLACPCVDLFGQEAEIVGDPGVGLGPAARRGVRD